MPLPVLAGKNIILRQPRMSDAEALAVNADDNEVARHVPRIPHPYSLQDAKSWINKSRRLTQNGNECHFAIYDKKSGEFAGMIGLRAINRHDRNAEVGYWVGRGYWNRGFAGEALSLILLYAFRKMRFRRVYAIVHQQNPASIRVLEKVGFMREGIWRQASRMGRKWYDVYAYGILKDEFTAVES